MAVEVFSAREGLCTSWKDTREFFGRDHVGATRWRNTIPGEPMLQGRREGRVHLDRGPLDLGERSHGVL